MPGLQVATPEGTDTHAHQFFDAQAEAGKHLAHLALQPLLQHHARTAGGKAGYIFGLGLAFRDAHPLQQLDEHAAVECLVKRDPVFLFHAATGVGQVLAHAAIVRENKQTLAVGIQSAHIVGVPVLGGQQVIHGADGALGLAAAHIASRLVQQDDHFLLRHGAATVHSHKISGHHAQSGGIHGLAIHFHAALGNEAVRGAAALVAAHGQKLIQAHAALRGCGVASIFRHSRFL